MEIKEKEVNFYIYCKKCKYEKLNEAEDPCNECLERGMNYQTEKPLKFEPKE